MFDFLGRIAAGHPRKILLCWGLLAVVLTVLAPPPNSAQVDEIRFLPDRYPVVRGYDLLEKAFPGDVAASRAVFVIQRPASPLSAADLELVDRLTDRLRSLRETEPQLRILGVVSHRDPVLGSRLISVDQQCTLIQLSLGSPYLSAETRDSVTRAETELRSILSASGDAPELHVTGPAGIGRDLVKASAESLDHSTLATVLLVVIVLLAVYRSPLLALIPLITIGMAVWVSLQLLSLITLIPGVQLVNVSQVFSVVILFGAGTDYCLFLISRCREEMEFGRPPEMAVVRAVRAVGGALSASAGTVICGLGMMGFAEFGRIRCAGPAIALGLLVGLLAALTITPALIRLGRTAIFWPQKLKLVSPATATWGIWDRISRIVVRRPGVIFVAGLLPLLPLAILGTQVEASYRPVGDLSPNSQSIRGLDMLQQHFTAGETGPITILLVSSKSWREPAGKELIDLLSRGFLELDNIAEVRSLTQPLGQPLAPAEPSATPDKGLSIRNLLSGRSAEAAIRRIALQSAEKFYINPIEEAGQTQYVTRIDVILKSDPFDSGSIVTLRLLEAWLRELLPTQSESFGPIRSEVCGVTVHMRDTGDVVARDQFRVNLMVTAGVFLILLIVVRRIWLAGYLLATVLLSFWATLGATSLFAAWLTGRPPGMIEWRVPFFLFTILVAVGEDYNILLVTRIMQERKRHGLIEGTRRGLAATGGTITACGVIMAGTFATLMLADLSTLKQIGFALSFGVILDTFIVRPLLVPALLLIVWKDEDDTPRPAVKIPLAKRFTAVRLPGV